MKEGLQSKRIRHQNSGKDIVYGESSNGLKYMGYKDNHTVLN